MKTESNVKTVMAPQDVVYARLSDLTNVSKVRERLDDPEFQQQLSQQMPDGHKIDEIRERLDSMQFDADSVSMDVPPIGNVAIRIIEREPEKCIKFESVNSPIHFYLWIQLLPLTDTSSKMRLTVDADVNPFMRMMVEKPLKEGVEKLADMLASLPY